MARTQDEAERQAAGEDVTAEQVDEEDTIAVEEVFDEGVEVNLDEDAAEAEAEEATIEEETASEEEAEAVEEEATATDDAEESSDNEEESED